MNGDDRREFGGFSLLEAEGGEDILWAGANVVGDSRFKLQGVSVSNY
jgi:hypothetical protein